MMKLTFHGHSAWEVATGGLTIWIDPFLRGNPAADVTPDQVTADFVAVTHAHRDHLGDTEEILERTGATLIGISELANHYAAKGYKTEALQIGGGQAFGFGRMKLVPADHSSSLDGVAMGREAGLLLTDREGTVLYHAGDTGLFSDMSLIGRTGLDVALLPIGDKFTMGPDDALVAVELLAPRLVIPMHYDTFEAIRQDAQAWKAAVEANTAAKVAVLRPGESIEVSASAATA